MSALRVPRPQSEMMFRSALLWVALRLEVAVIICAFFAFTSGRPDSFDQRFCL